MELSLVKRYRSPRPMVIQSEPPQARSAVTLFPSTKVSFQKKWRPMLGRKPKLMRKVGKIPPLWSGPKAKKLKTAGPQFPFSAAVATAPIGVRMTYSVTRYAGRRITRGTQISTSPGVGAGGSCPRQSGTGRRGGRSVGCAVAGASVEGAAVPDGCPGAPCDGSGGGVVAGPLEGAGPSAGGEVAGPGVGAGGPGFPGVSWALATEEARASVTST